MKHLLVLLLLPLLLWGSCSLNDAGFGRACEVDDDCRGDVKDADLVCLPVEGERRCVGAAFVEVTATGETCADAIALALDVRTPGNTGTALNDLNAICAGADAPERAYRIDLAERTNLRVVLEPDGFDGALYASVAEDCLVQLPGACVDDESSAGTNETMQLPGVGPGRLYIVVDGANQLLLGTSGSFHITVSTDGGCGIGKTAVDGRCVGLVGEAQQVVARTNAAATLLTDGRVLVTGGRTGNDMSTTTTAELFDPETNTFSATGSMSVDRARHCSERMQDGRVLVAGGVRGRDGDYLPTASAEVYTPATGLFTPAPDLPRPRDLFTCTEMGGGRGVVAIGGRDEQTTLGDVLVLDPAVTGWTAQLPLLESRFGHLAFLFDDADDVLIVGGRTGTSALALDSVENFSTGGGATVFVEPLGDPRAAAAGVVLDDRHVVVFGGYEGSFDDVISGKSSAAIYDDVDDDWRDTVSNMTEPRLFGTANLIPGLCVIIAAGSQDAPVASVDAWVAVDDEFISLPPLRHARLAHAAVTLDDGRVLIVGGDGGDETTEVPLATAELIGVEP